MFWKNMEKETKKKIHLLYFIMIYERIHDNDSCQDLWLDSWQFLSQHSWQFYYSIHDSQYSWIHDSTHDIFHDSIPDSLYDSQGCCHMVQIEAPSTPECQEGVPNLCGQQEEEVFHNQVEHNDKKGKVQNSWACPCRLQVWFISKFEPLIFNKFKSKSIANGK